MEITLRLEALKLAVERADYETEDSEILKTADKYFDFLIKGLAHE